jgi:hypothetical protein
VQDWSLATRRGQRCRPRLLRRDGDAGGNVVFDRQVVALQGEAHALLGELVRLGIVSTTTIQRGTSGDVATQVSSSWR